MSESDFRTRYIRTLYPCVRLLGALLVVAGLVLDVGLRTLLGVHIETLWLVYLTQGLLVLAGVLLILSRYYLSPQLILSACAVLVFLADLHLPGFRVFLVYLL
jgi:hypothetical protein